MLEQVPDQESIIESWLKQLLLEGGVDFMEVPRIHIQVSRFFQFKLMGVEDPQTVALAEDIDKWLDSHPPSSGTGTPLKDFLERAKADLAELHPSICASEYTAHFLLRMAKKCVDPT